MFAKIKHFVKVQNSTLFMLGIYGYFNYSQTNRLFPHTCLWINLLLRKLLRTRDIASNINKHVKEHAQLLSTIKKWIQATKLGIEPIIFNSTSIGTRKYNH